MKDLKNYITENKTVTREDCINDYELVKDCDNATKKTIAAKYGVESSKKDVIRHEILIKMRELRKTTKKYDEEDAHYFMRLEDWSPMKMIDFLKEESMDFVLWFQQYMYDRFFKDSKKMQSWIGMNPGNNAYDLSYSDKNNIKMYNKILEYIASAAPKKRTPEDDILDMLINKFTGLLADYKKEYLDRVAAYAKKYYNDVPGEIESAKVLREKISNKMSKLHWNDDGYSELSNQYRKIQTKIDRLNGLLKRFTEKEYIDRCVEDASKEFESNIKTLSTRIMDEHINVEKMVIKSVHDDPKVFNMKITDGEKNLFCRSIIAAAYSQYMVPHYRFIITNRTKDDSHYFD